MSTQLTVLTEKQMTTLIEPKKAELVRLIGRDNLTRETSFAIQAVNANSFLATAEPTSVAKCIWNVAITGLSLNPVLKLAYITPRKKKEGGTEAILMPSYQGMVKLITDTGSVKQVIARVVYEGDEFTVDYGMDTNIIHRPKFKHKPDEKAAVTHAYAIAVLSDGSKQFEVMSAEEINVIRDRSDSYRAFKNGKAQSAIWDSDYGEMCRKTVIKRLCKYLPKSVHNEKWEKLMTAVDIDNKEYPASYEQKDYALRLMDNSTYDEEQRKYIKCRIEDDLSMGEIEGIIEDLKLNQLAAVDTPIYSVTDAKVAVNNIIGD